MEHFVIIVNGWKPLTIITKCSILDVAAVLDPSLDWTQAHVEKKSIWKLIYQVAGIFNQLETESTLSKHNSDSRLKELIKSINILMKL